MATTSDACYYCGQSGADSRDHIPGKLFGVVGNAGLILPAHSTCNRAWDADQEFFRLRIVLHTGSSQGAEHIKERELLRVKGSAGKAPQRERYLRERAKTFIDAAGGESMGLTDSDYMRIQNVVRHWAAGVHFANSGTSPALPGLLLDTVAAPKVNLEKLRPALARNQS